MLVLVLVLVTVTVLERVLVLVLVLVLVAVTLDDDEVEVVVDVLVLVSGPEKLHPVGSQMPHSSSLSQLLLVAHQCVPSRKSTLVHRR